MSGRLRVVRKKRTGPVKPAEPFDSSSDLTRKSKYTQNPLENIKLYPPRPSISTNNINTFYVGYDDYKTNPESEAKLYAEDGWWRGAAFQPADHTRIQVMNKDETLLWRLLNSDTNGIIISGKAGSGKSNLLQRFVTSCEGTNFAHALTAPTGIASFNVGGETLHRRLGLGLAKDDPVSLFRLICKARRKFGRTWKFLCNTDILIIDEISMVHPDFFTKLDYLFRKCRQDERPFGGVKIVMVGDFTQLGPVIIRDRNVPVDPDKPRMVLDTECWKLMKLSRMFLTRSYRQKDGDPFLELLNEVRMGKLSEKGLALLRSRINADVEIHQEQKKDSEDVKTEENKQKKTYKLQPIDIFPYKSQVHRCNQANLDVLIQRDGAEVKSFFPALRVSKREHASTLDIKEYQRAKNMISPDGIKTLSNQFAFFHIKLAVGAQVMMRNNKYIDLGIYNGTMGIVTGIEANFISVVFVVNGKFMDKPVEVDRAEFSVRVGKTVEIIMTQFPLTLAYSSTIHKIQGLTLDSVRLDASNCFEAGQLYVALSRVRKLEHLTLIDFREKSLLSDPRAIEFESLPENLSSDLAPPSSDLSASDNQPPAAKKRRLEHDV